MLSAQYRFYGECTLLILPVVALAHNLQLPMPIALQDLAFAVLLPLHLVYVSMILSSQERFRLLGGSGGFSLDVGRVHGVRATLPYQILSVSLNLIISRRRSGRTIAHSSSLAARSSGRCSYITKVESSALRR